MLAAYMLPPAKVEAENLQFLCTTGIFPRLCGTKSIAATWPDMATCLYSDWVMVTLMRMNVYEKKKYRSRKSRRRL